jgi:hypothetical protein
MVSEKFCTLVDGIREITKSGVARTKFLISLFSARVNLLKPSGLFTYLPV